MAAANPPAKKVKIGKGILDSLRNIRVPAPVVAPVVPAPATPPVPCRNLLERLCEQAVAIEANPTYRV